MAIESEDWFYVGGAAVGGLLLGALADSLFSSAPEPAYTGLSRNYEKGEDKVAASVYALPDGGYVVRLERGAKDAFPDFESPVYMFPFLAALGADDIMWQLDYAPKGLWAPVVNEASEAVMKEKAPAKVAGRRRA